MTGPAGLPPDDAVGPVVESFLARVRRGERPAVTEWIGRHPELAEELREILPALLELEALGEAAGPRRERPEEGDGAADGPVPDRLGEYRLVRRIGGGGMGVVYEAEHESLRSRVALKVMHHRFRSNPAYLRRFHIEARSAAGLHHTNIVGVFDYGEQAGVCYYAMHFIHGQPLDRVLTDLRRLRDDGRERAETSTADGPRTSSVPRTVSLARTVAEGLATGRPLSLAGPDIATLAMAAETVEHGPDRGRADGEPGEPASGPASLGSSSLGGSIEGRYAREVARICAQVADALEYVHRRGVLHRDIKPPNLLLDGLGNVWVTDFGLAKLEESGDETASRDLVGTLRYMAPERFRGTSDRRGDIYSLGATMYELLTLRPAFDGTDQLRLIDRIVHEPPVPPRQVDRNVPRDLETIVLKAMAKDPKDRFGSARELGEELLRFVEGRPIRSRPVSTAERFWRWCKRDPWLAGACVTAASLIVLLTVVSTTAAYVYRNQGEALRVERGRAQDATFEARRRAVAAYTAQANTGRFSHRPGQRFETLEAVTAASKLLDGLPAGPELASTREVLRDLAIAALSLPDVRHARTFAAASTRGEHPDIDPAFRRFALCDRKTGCVVYRLSDGAELFRCPTATHGLDGTPRFGPDGRLLAVWDDGGSLRLWRVDGPKPVLVAEVGNIANTLKVLSFHEDGSGVVCAFLDGSLASIDGGSGRRRPLPTGGDKVVAVACHPDGRRLAVVTERDGKSVAAIRGLDDPTPTASLTLPVTVDDLGVSPDGRRLALSAADSTLRVWEFERPGSSPLVMTEPNSGGTMLAFNHAGDLLGRDPASIRPRVQDPLGHDPAYVSGGCATRVVVPGLFPSSTAQLLGEVARLEVIGGER